MTQTTERPPVLFLSHGAPPLADDARWTRELAEWSGAVGKPKDILMISAHWENAPVTLSATRRPAGLVYDFWGFPQKYYDVTYAADARLLRERVPGYPGTGYWPSIDIRT